MQSANSKLWERKSLHFAILTFLKKIYIYILSITLYLSYRYLVIMLPAPRSPMGSSFSSFLRWCWLSCCGAFVQVSWRNKSGAITLSSSDGLSSLKAYYSGGAVRSRMMVLMCSFWILWWCQKMILMCRRTQAATCPVLPATHWKKIMNKFSNISVFFLFFL